MQRRKKSEKNMNGVSLEKTTLKYRPNIDGLRAVAVLSVLAFHTGLKRIKDK
jgi:peptidoglycan/LPS O-acetylase OafA/YrhL